MIIIQGLLHANIIVLLIGYNTFDFSGYIDKRDNCFISGKIGLSSGTVTNQQIFLWDDTNKILTNVSATISSTGTVYFDKMIELEAGELYVSEHGASDTYSNANGLYKFDYTNNIFVIVNTYGFNYRVVRNTTTEAIFGVNSYSNSNALAYSIVYDKNAGTYTASNSTYKKGKKFAGDMFACSTHIYHPSTDTLETTSGNYTTLMNDIGDEASYNYGLSLATGTKYLIYNK